MWWMQQAQTLENLTRRTEAEKQELFWYSAPEARTATIHIREDLVLLVSLVSAVNQHLTWIVRLLITMVVVLAYIAVRISL
jgi:hypothetical protein